MTKNTADGTIDRRPAFFGTPGGFCALRSSGRPVQNSVATGSAGIRSIGRNEDSPSSKRAMSGYIVVVRLNMSVLDGSAPISRRHQRRVSRLLKNYG